MSTQRRQFVIKASKASKIQLLMDDPQLPALIETLPAQSLSELINQIGIENSHAIVAHASNDQLKGVLDIQLWQGVPGKQEKLKVDDFFPWLENWNELGAEFVSEKLQALGDEFVALCFTKHLTAADVTVVGAADPYSVGLDGGSYDFGRFDVQPKGGAEEIEDEAIWYVLLDTLHHLHTTSPDFLDAVLTRCSFVRSILKEDISEHHVSEELHEDLGQERDQRAEKTGYVTAIDAFAFLSLSRDSTIREVLAGLQYDELSRRHFRLEDFQQAAEAEETPHEASASPEATESGEEQLQVLTEALEDLGIAPAKQRVNLLLPGGSTKPDSITQLLDHAMVSLQEESPEMFEKRRREILYLANILIAGIGLRGAAFTEMNAVRAVRSTCNLGLEYLVRHHAQDPDELHFEFLSLEPGLLRPFHIGFHLLNQIPLTCIEAVVAFLSGEQLISRLRRRPWISAELDGILPGQQLITRVQDRNFEDLKHDIEMLALVLEPTSVHCLEHLVDGFPVFPRILRMRPPPVYLDRTIRFISDLQDLDEIQQYVTNLQIDL